MGSIHFPANPKANNVYTLNGKVWWYDGMSWNARDRGLANPCPLDNLSATANVAYGCRLLTQAYYGQPMVMIRRASDNSNTIFYAVNDVQANIVSWLTGTTGYVVVLYDQSGSGLNLNLIQASFNNQPKWNVNCQNGQAAMDFITANGTSLISNTSSTLNASNVSFSVYHSGYFHGPAGGGWGAIASMGNAFAGSGSWLILQDTGGGGSGAYGVFFGGTGREATGLNLLDNVWKSLFVLANNNTGIVTFYSNNNVHGTGAASLATNPATSSFTIAIGPTTDQFTGSIGEIAYFIGNSTSQFSVTDMSQINSSGLFYWGAN